jgi:hypothetical protein
MSCLRPTQTASKMWILDWTQKRSKKTLKNTPKSSLKSKMFKALNPIVDINTQ